MLHVLYNSDFVLNKYLGLKVTISSKDSDELKNDKGGRDLTIYIENYKTTD